MSKKFQKKPLILSLGAAVATTLAAVPIVNAETNPFSMNELSSGYMQVAQDQTDTMEMKGDKKDMQCGAGKCGANKGGKDAEGNCAGDKKADGSCGAGKCGASKDKAAGKADGSCGAGKCGASKDKAAGAADGKCGAGKCGGAKMDKTATDMDKTATDMDKTATDAQ